MLNAVPKPERTPSQRGKHSKRKGRCQRFMRNTYEVSNGQVKMDLWPQKCGVAALLDATELPRLVQFGATWRADLDAKHQCCRVKAMVWRDGKYKSIYLARFLMNCPDQMQVDHINHDPLDNRLDNLRICTQAENKQNRKGPQRNNTSGVSGVSKRRNLWHARINVNGKRVHLGYYRTIAEAAEVVTRARAAMVPFSQEALANAERT